MDLQQLTDEVLEKNLVDLFAKERVLLCVIILHVMEVERRKSYMKSHRSLFEYLQDVSKYSHGTTQRRVSAAMLAFEIPEILRAIKSGSLNLTQVTTAQLLFRRAAKQKKCKITTETKLKVLKAIVGKTVKDSEVIICSILQIKPKTKTKITHQADGSVRVEITYTKEEWALIERAKELLSHSVPTGDLVELTIYMCGRVIAHKDKTIPKSPRKNQNKEAKADAAKVDHERGAETPKDASEGEVKIPNGISKTESKIPNGISGVDVSKGTSLSGEDKKIPNGISKQVPESEPAPGLSQVAPRPTRFAEEYYQEQRLKKSAARQAIPASEQREVFTRDQCCQHKNPLTGQTCGSRWQLQVDHIQPVWAGGTNEIQNLRLLCGAHNREIYKAQSGLRNLGVGVRNH
jgi:hypothetical protein